MHIVKFTKPFRGYNAGETAGFPPDEAETLIQSGFVESVPDAKKAAAEKAAAEEAAKKAAEKDKK